MFSQSKLLDSETLNLAQKKIELLHQHVNYDSRKEEFYKKLGKHIRDYSQSSDQKINAQMKIQNGYRQPNMHDSHPNFPEED